MCSFREYHIDTNDCLQGKVLDENIIYGANLSIRRDTTKKPLMIIGQDESSFHQYIFAKKSWKGMKGLSQLVPKSVGEVMMISGYQSREFGLGLGQLLTDDVIKEVNRQRLGTKYLSKNDSKLLTTLKISHLCLMIQQ